MQVLFDTNILVIIAQRQFHTLAAGIRALVDPQHNVFASAASLWEIAIKTRLGKLNPGLPLEDLPQFYTGMNFTLLAIDHHHAVELVDPLPATKDPFDRLLLAQCQVEGLRLVTLDGHLTIHPLAWKG